MSCIKLFGPDKVAFNYDNITPAFIKQIAESLLQTHVLVVGEKEFRLAEVEFYINSESHKDEYTHGDPAQKVYNAWYFHRYKDLV